MKNTGYAECIFQDMSNAFSERLFRNKKEGIITIKDNNKEKGLQQAHIKNQESKIVTWLKVK